MGNKKITKLVLDYSKWHCGDNDEVNGLGKGCVCLLNNEGFMCCLGQWCEQMGVPKEMLLGHGEPGDIKYLCHPFNADRNENERTTVTTQLSNECILINDSKTTSPERKIQLLEELLKSEAILLEVINKPE